MYNVTTTTAAYIDSIKKLNEITDTILQTWKSVFSDDKEEEILAAHEAYQNMILRLMNANIIETTTSTDYKEI